MKMTDKERADFAEAHVVEEMKYANASRDTAARLFETLKSARSQLYNARAEIDCLGRELTDLNEQMPHRVRCLPSDDVLDEINDMIAEIDVVLQPNAGRQALAER